MKRKLTIFWICLLVAAGLLPGGWLLGGCAQKTREPGQETGGSGTVADVTDAPSGEEAFTPSGDNGKNPENFETAAECAVNMKAGWNVGNSLDSTGSWIGGDDPESFETAWGNPVITQELIHAVQESGFNAVRVPVTWFEHMDENGKVSEAWLARVREVVDYVMEEDMYCIINVHHDTGGGNEAWLRADSEMYENGMSERYAYLWEQIADYFKDCDERLLFEGFNEILDRNSSWGGSDMENYRVVYQLNQLFVDTVRASGGNNACRNLIVNTYGASSAGSQVGGFWLPSDSAENHLLVEVHIYDPADFCGGEKATWEESDEKVLDTIFERLNSEIITRYEVPLIVGEFGTQDHFETEEYIAERVKYTSYFVSAAREYGITCFWWDDGGSMKIFDRQSAEPYCRPVIDAMIAASEAAH